MDRLKQQRELIRAIKEASIVHITGLVQESLEKFKRFPTDAHKRELAKTCYTFALKVMTEGKTPYQTNELIEMQQKFMNAFTH